jgi:hypothetical protein
MDGFDPLILLFVDLVGQLLFTRDRLTACVLMSLCPRACVASKLGQEDSPVCCVV